MVKFSAYHPDRHYNPNKPNKYGFKVYILAESVTVFVLQYQIALRKNEIQKKQANKDEKQTQIICFSLLSAYRGKEHSLYLDSYYTSPSMFINLVNSGFNACGSVQLKRLF